MNKLPNKAIYLISLLLFITTISINAQNTVGYGPKTKSMAGAGLANVESSLWGNFNPGGQVFLGQKLGLGIEVVSPTASYEVIGEPTLFGIEQSIQWPLGLEPGYMEAEKKTAIMPQLGFNMAVGDNSTMSISIYGNSNSGFSYNTKTYHSSVIESFGSHEGFINPMGVVTSPTFLKLNQYFSAITYSRKIGDNVGIGISVIGAWQSLNIGGLEAFGSLPNYSAFPDEVSGNGIANSYGVGGKLGVQWNVSEKFQLGLAFRSKIFMSSFESYKGFISESGKLDVPPEWNIGIVYKPFERFFMAFDVNRYCYSHVPAWGLAMEQNNSIGLGGDNGGGFGRKDQMSYKFGVQYRIPKWQFRAGYAHTDQAVVDQEVALNLLMPNITSEFLSFGFSRQIGKEYVNIAVVKGLENSLIGLNALDKAQSIEITNDLWILEVSVEF